MPTKINSGAVLGLEGMLVEVETDISPGLPTTIIVGLPDTAVQEAKERVKSAIKNTNFSYPRGRVAVNLAPADIPKTGSHYDLPIAVSILIAGGLINVENFDPAQSLFLGELALDGRVRPVSGVLPIAEKCRSQNLTNIFLPVENAHEAALISGLNIFPVPSLESLVAHLEGRVEMLPIAPIKPQEKISPGHIDFSDIAGQQLAKRALTIAAAGGHNVLFTGPPGSGKTMLAKALRGILPPLTEGETIETTKIYSIAGLLMSRSEIVTNRPFRSPHHTSSRIALIGGGANPKPGEVTLAHRGVLFLDEFAEFPRSVLESLRQPLEDGVVSISRAAGSVRFPAEFILIASQNPCPCGNYGNPKVSCQCSDGDIKRYRARVSGPLLDRIDLVVEVPQQSYEQLKVNGGTTSLETRAQVARARIAQIQRYGSAKTNSRLEAAEIKLFCQPDDEGEKLLSTAVNKMNLSARSFHRLLKVARTIADLEGANNIIAKHITEAVQYRWKFDQN